jgi:thioredoxin 1
MKKAGWLSAPICLFAIGISVFCGCNKSYHVPSAPALVVPTATPEGYLSPTTTFTPTATSTRTASPTRTRTTTPAPTKTVTPTQTATSTVTATLTPVPTPDGSVKNVTQTDFTQEVLAASIPVMVEFFATWCHYCQAFNPTVDQFALNYAGHIKVVRVDVDLNPGLVSNYGIQGYPTSIFFVNGSATATLVGGVSLSVLSSVADSILAAP